MNMYAKTTKIAEDTMLTIARDWVKLLNLMQKWWRGWRILSS